MDLSTLVDWLLNQSVPLVILVGIGWFFGFRFWPWLTKEYFPARNDIERARDQALVLVGRHLENAAIAFSHFAVTMSEFAELCGRDLVSAQSAENDPLADS